MVATLLSGWRAMLRVAVKVLVGAEVPKVEAEKRVVQTVKEPLELTQEAMEFARELMADCGMTPLAVGVVVLACRWRG